MCITCISCVPPTCVVRCFEFQLFINLVQKNGNTFTHVPRIVSVCLPTPLGSLKGREEGIGREEERICNLVHTAAIVSSLTTVLNLRLLPRLLLHLLPFSCSSSSPDPLVHHQMETSEQNQCAFESRVAQ